jgi:hypothetical protein
METEVKESNAGTGNGGRLAQVINEWRDCGHDSESEPASSNEELSGIVNEWRDCGDAGTGS